MIANTIYYWTRKISGGTFLGKFFRLGLKLLPKKLIIPILRGPAKGKKWVVGSAHHGFWLGIYELEVQNTLSNLLKNGDVFYDIGANAGFFTVLGSQLVGAEKGNVIAFEPLPDNVDLLLNHIKINDLKNVSVVEKAVSSTNGTAKMKIYLYEDAALDRLLAGISSDGNIKVKTVAIDNMVFSSKILPPNVIKMDIEGAEFLALCGMEKTIEKYRPTILLSTHGDKVDKQCRDFLNSRGYKITPLSAGKIKREDELLCVYQKV